MKVLLLLGTFFFATIALSAENPDPCLSDMDVVECALTVAPPERKYALQAGLAALGPQELKHVQDLLFDIQLESEIGYRFEKDPKSLKLVRKNLDQIITILESAAKQGQRRG